jgi:hypothetical protein
MLLRDVASPTRDLSGYYPVISILFDVLVTCFDWRGVDILVSDETLVFSGMSIDLPEIVDSRGTTAGGTRHERGKADNRT